MSETEKPDWLVPGPRGTEYYTDERCYITELANAPSMPASLAIARVEPGVTTQLHALTDVTETYVLRCGEGLIEIDGESARVVAGDQVVIPPGISQRITNTGGADLEFYCICTPRFEPHCYVVLEEEPCA